MSQPADLRIGVIGLGAMGSRHARACSQLREVELVGVADVKSDVVNAIAEELGVQGYADYRALLERTDLDAVVVATPDQFHREPCEAIASRGLHVFLEKPIATTLEDARAIIEVTRANGVKMMVGHTLRYDPRYICVQEAASSGKFGDIIHMYARRNATIWSGRRIEGRAEVVVFQGVHDIDFFHWVTGARVTRVWAESVSKALTSLGVADTMMATLRFSDGAIALLEQSWGLPYGLPSMLDAQLEVVGTEGAAYLDLRAQAVSLFTGGTYSQPDVILNLPGAHFLKDEYERFLAFVAGEAEPVVSGEEAYEALRVADAIVRSAKNGEPVDL